MHYAIIAAGEGSRLAQEGVKLPKPLVQIGDKPMIQRLIDIFMESDPESLSIIVNEQMTQVQDFVRSLKLPVPLNLVVKSTPSSMHSFYEVSRAMGRKGKFVLTTVDTIFQPEDFKAYVHDFAQNDAIDGSMAVTPFVDDEKPLYVATNEQQRITAFLDNPHEGVKYVSGGIYGLTPIALDILDDCMAQGVSRMRNYQRALVGAGLDLRAFPIPKIMDIDHSGDLEKAQQFVCPQS